MADTLRHRVHPSAIISAAAQLPADVRIGAACVIEGEVRLGPGCVLEDHAYLIGPLVLGCANRVCGRAVLGERPQHLHYAQPLGLEIGDGNTFRAKVTIHQGTAGATRNGNHFLFASHVGHDCQVGNGCVLSSNALLGGHCVVGDGVRVGRRAGVHQFCRLGRMCRLRAGALTTKDIPPFVVQSDYNTVTGINDAVMREAGLSEAQVTAIERLYEILYERGLTVPAALTEAEGELGAIDIVREFVAFVRIRGRGINDTRPG
jgi:UDP-N-acetylglucosamine acyltransferase